MSEAHTPAADVLLGYARTRSHGAVVVRAVAALSPTPSLCYTSPRAPVVLTCCCPTFTWLPGPASTTGGACRRRSRSARRARTNSFCQRSAICADWSSDSAAPSVRGCHRPFSLISRLLLRRLRATPGCAPARSSAGTGCGPGPSGRSASARCRLCGCHSSMNAWRIARNCARCHGESSQQSASAARWPLTSSSDASALTRSQTAQPGLGVGLDQRRQRPPGHLVGRLGRGRGAATRDRQRRGPGGRPPRRSPSAPACASGRSPRRRRRAVGRRLPISASVGAGRGYRQLIARHARSP